MVPNLVVEKASCLVEHWDYGLVDLMAGNWVERKDVQSVVRMVDRSVEMMVE